MATKSAKDPFEDLPTIKAPAQGKDPFEDLPVTHSISSGEETPKPQSNISELESAGLGALQGGSLGFADELEGGLKALPEAMISDKKLKDLYQQYRDMARKRYSEAKEANPKSYLAGELGGGLTSAVIPGGAIAKGIGLGAGSALGASDADLTKGEIGQATKDTIIGGTIGGTLGAVGQKIGTSLAPEAMDQSAAVKALKAVGIKPNLGRNIPGVENPVGSNIPVGKTILEQEALPIMGGAENIQKTLSEKASEGIQKTGPILREASDAIKTNPQLASNRPPISSTLYSTLQSELNNLPKTGEMIGLGESIEKNVMPWLYEIQQAKNDPIALDKAKKGMYATVDHLSKNAYENPDSGFKVNIYKKLNNVLKNEIEGVVGSATGAESQQALSETNQNISNLIKAQKSTGNLITKDLENPSGELGFNKQTGALGTALASMAVNPLAGGTAATGIATKMGVEKFTGQPINRLANIIGARTQYAGSKALASPIGESAVNLGKAISQSGVQTGIQSLYRQAPEKLKAIADDFMQNKDTQNLGTALNKALGSDDSQSRDSILFAIEQNPNARMRLKALLGESNGDGS